MHLDYLIKDEDKEEAKDMEKDNKEEDGTRVEGEEEAGVTGHTQQSEARCWNQAMRAAMPHSKLVPTSLWMTPWTCTLGKPWRHLENEGN